ncbi:MAG: hypothetical protein QM751_05485 [Paludibacteraceae bacterium]
MQKIIALLMFISLLFTACCSTQKATNVYTDNVTLPDTGIMTNKFRMLWNEIASKTDNFTTIDTYIPSETQIAKFNLKKRDSQYFINGFIKTNSELSTEKMQDLSRYITRYSSDLYSFSIPINKIADLIKIEHIISVDLSSRANLRK